MLPKKLQSVVGGNEAKKLQLEVLKGLIHTYMYLHMNVYTCDQICKNRLHHVIIDFELEARKHQTIFQSIFRKLA